MKNRIIILILSTIVFILTEVNFTGNLLEFKRIYNSSIIEPISYISLSLALTYFILLFASTNVVKLWRNSFILWYIPLSLVLIFFGSTGPSFIWPSRSDFAITLGGVMLLVTLVIVLTQKFYFRR